MEVTRRLIVLGQVSVSVSILPLGIQYYPSRSQPSVKDITWSVFYNVKNVPYTRDHVKELRR